LGLWGRRVRGFAGEEIENAGLGRRGREGAYASEAYKQARKRKLNGSMRSGHYSFLGRLVSEGVPSRVTGDVFTKKKAYPTNV
jgi:hypothetical protein